MPFNRDSRHVHFAEAELEVPPELSACSDLSESTSALYHTHPPPAASMHADDHGPTFLKRSLSSDDLYDLWTRRHKRYSKIATPFLPKGLSVLDKMMLEVSRFNQSESDGMSEVEAMLRELQHSSEKSHRKVHTGFGH